MVSASFSIHPAKQSDYPAVITMIQGLALEEGGQSTLDEAALAAQLCHDAPKLECWVARVQDETIGCVLAYAGYDVQSATRGWHVSDIYVMPDMRGQGIGRALLLALPSESGQAWSSWTVLRSNKAARRFYAALGAEEVDVAFMALATH